MQGMYTQVELDKFEELQGSAARHYTVPSDLDRRRGFYVPMVYSGDARVDKRAESKKIVSYPKNNEQSTRQVKCIARKLHPGGTSQV